MDFGALTHLDEACQWYNRQRPGLGDAFLVSIAEAFTKLEQNPERYRVLYKGFRRVLVERFPYKIFYQMKGDNVIVFRVLHHGRDFDGGSYEGISCAYRRRMA